jgi:hypothetical protein
MQTLRSKTATAIAIFLVLTIAATLVALPTVTAHVPALTRPTWTYVSVTPLVVGINQPVIIVWWCNFIPPTAYGAYGDRWHFYVNVVKPDGTNDTYGPLTSDPVGGGWLSYTPTQLGTYTIQARRPDEVVTGLPVSPAGMFSGASEINDTYAASMSEPEHLTVQQEQLTKYAETPLPTGLWTRPVYGNNRDWWSVMGQWLAGPSNPGRINAYSDGPESSHILWTRPVWLGGIMGGEIGVNSIQRQYYSGQSYESYGGPSLIVEGKIFYSVGQPPAYGWYCVDLYTGKTLYYENNTDGHHAMPSMGQILNIDNPNQHGGFAYLWRTSGVALEDPNTTVIPGRATWELLDAYTGNMICRIGNISAPSFAMFFGPVSGAVQFTDSIGSICYMDIPNLGTAANPNFRLTIWNTTQNIWANTTSSFGVVYWSWRPTGSGTHAGRTYGTGFDAANGYSLNVTIPAVQGTIRQIVVDKYVIGGTTGNITGNPNQRTQGNFWALSLERGKEGTLLWNFTFTPPAGLGDAAIQSGLFSGHDTSYLGMNDAAGVFYYGNTMKRVLYVYSLNKDKTGKDQGTLLWTSEPEAQWNFYGISTSVYRGRLYSYGYAGILNAYNITTGHIDWNWSAPYVGLDETQYQHTPLSLGCIADGKFYLYTSEHSVNSPIRRDAKIYCVDAETGKLYWAESNWPSSGPIISDGRLVCYDILDGAIACYGQGSSKTTVSAPQTVPAQGSSVTITGTVTDDTPTGRLNTNAAGTSSFNSLNVPKSGDYDFVLRGTPAISDADMDAWMEYMYHQRPIPANAKGVEVTLDAIDPNNNYIHIGTVTSDITGAYGFVWKPEVPGTYQIIATFAGSAAYSASFAETYMGVGEAPPTPAAPEPAPPLPPFEMYTLYATIAIIIAVAIATLLLLRKKP